MLLITAIKVRDKGTNLLLDSLSKRHLRIPVEKPEELDNVKTSIIEGIRILWDEQRKPLIRAGVVPNESRELIFDFTISDPSSDLPSKEVTEEVRMNELAMTE